MEIKSMTAKVASVNFILIMVLLGNSMFLLTPSTVWAQTSTPTTSSSSVFPDSKASVTPASASSSNPTSEQSQKGNLAKGKNLFLLLILGVLGVWNALLSYLVWINFNEARKMNHKTFKKIKDLDAKDILLDQRINRKSNAINEMREQISAHNKTLEVVQLQAKPRKTDNYDLKSQNKPVSYRNDDIFLSQEYNYSTRSANDSQSTPISNEPWDRIVQNYNLSPHMLENNIIERVSESEESVDNRRGNSNAAILLKAANNYSYWIFIGEDKNYWLTPKSDLKITPMGFDTLQVLFECSEYQQGSRMQLIKPAKVSQNPSSGGWDLINKGKVQFIW
jgi:hypothetical protein